MYFNSEPCSLLKKKKFRWCRCSFEVVTYRGLHCKCGQCQPRLPSLPVVTPSANMVLSLCPLAQWVSLPPVYLLKVAAFLDLPFSLFLVYPVLGSSLGKSLLSPYPSVRGSASLSSLRCGSLLMLLLSPPLSEHPHNCQHCFPKHTTLGLICFKAYNYYPPLQIE